MADVNSTANFSSVVDEINKVSKAYGTYAKQSGKVIRANKLIVQSLKDINTQMREMSGLLGKSNTPVKKFTQSLNQHANSATKGATAQAGFNTAVKRVGTTSTKVSKQVNGTAKAVQSLTLSMQTFVRLGLFSLASRAIGAFTSGLQQASSTAIDFEKKIGSIRTISSESQLSFETWARSIRDVSDEFNLDLLDATASAYQSISNQVVKGADTFEFLKTSAKLAVVAQGTLGEATNALSSIIKSYGLESGDASILSDKLFKTAELGRVPLNSIAETMGTVTVIANSAGISFDEVSASLATMTVQGIKPVKAITFLRNTILKILKPTQAMKDIVEQMGFESAESAVRVLGLGRFLSELSDRTKGTSSELAELLGSVRAMQFGFSVSGKGLDLYNANLKKIQNSAGFVNAQIGEVTQTVGFQFEKELNKATNALVEFGRELNVGLLKGIKTLGGLKEIIETVGKLIKGAVLFGAVTLLNRGFVSLNATILKTSVQMGVFTVASSRAGRNMIKLGATIKVLGRSLKALSSAFLPFLVIEGVLLLVDNHIESIVANTKKLEDAETRASSKFKTNVQDRIKLFDQQVLSQDVSQKKVTSDFILQINVQSKALRDASKKNLAIIRLSNKNRLKDTKFTLNAIKKEEKILSDEIKILQGVLDSISKARADQQDRFFGKDFGNLDRLPNLREGFQKALIEGTAKDIEKSFKNLKDSLEGIISNTKNTGLKDELEQEIGFIISQAQKSTEDRLATELKAQKKIVAERQRLEEKARKEARVQDLLGRSSSADVAKATTKAEATIIGEQRIAELVEAKALATGVEQANIVKQIVNVDNLLSAKLLQLDQDQLDKAKKVAREQTTQVLDAMKDQITEDTKTIVVGQTLAEGIARLTSGKTDGRSILQSRGLDKKLFQREANRIKQAQELERTIERISEAQVKLSKGEGIDVGGLKRDLESLSETNRLTTEQVSIVEKLNGLISAENKSFNELNTKSIVRIQDRVKGFVDLSKSINQVTKETLLLNKALKGDEESFEELKKQFDLRKKEEKVLIESQKVLNKEKKESLVIAKDLEDVANKRIEREKKNLENGIKTTGKNKEVEKSLQEEVTSEGTVDGLESISSTLVTIWTDIFGEALINSSKAIPDVSGEAGEGDRRPSDKDPIPVKLTDVGTPLGRPDPSSETRFPVSEGTKIQDKIEVTENRTDISIKQREEMIKQLKEQARQARNRDPNTVLGKINRSELENRDFAQKAEGVGSAIGSIGNVALGTSKSLDLTGLKALQLGEGFNKATGAVQFFANQLLGGKKKGLTSRQRNSSILQGAVGGATAGASVGGGYGAVAGAFLGAGIAYYQTRQKGGLIYRAGGGGVPSPAKGTDTVPAMLTQGEFVVNRQSTDKFYSQLKAMNSMTYRADGGRVSNSTVTVGDVNVSPNANSSSNGTDVKQIGNQIRRDIRAGRMGSFT